MSHVEGWVVPVEELVVVTTEVVVKTQIRYDRFVPARTPIRQGQTCSSFHVNVGP